MQAATSAEVLILPPMVMPRSFPPGMWEVELSRYTVWQQNNVSAADDDAGGLPEARSAPRWSRESFHCPVMPGVSPDGARRKVVTTVSSDLGIVPVGSHPQCEVSDGWRGVDRDDKKIDPLRIMPTSPLRNQSTAIFRPLASRIRRAALSHPILLSASPRTKIRWAPSSSIAWRARWRDRLTVATTHHLGHPRGTTRF